ncbi:hypothetical protein Ancab_018365 [Ancistrocladus abbreviatus]
MTIIDGNNKSKSNQMKRRRIEEATSSSYSKKLRSHLPRRRRDHISPILFNVPKSTKLLVESKLKSKSNSTSLAFSLNSTCCDEVSCNTSAFNPAIQAENEEYRRVTRSYSRRREKERAKLLRDVEMEVSANSCVESCSVKAEAESKVQSKGNEVAVVVETVTSAQITGRSGENSSAAKFKENVAIAENYGGGKCEAQVSEITGSCTNVNLSSLNSPSSTIEQRTRGSRVELDLACLERFTDGDDIFEVSSGNVSELQSEILAGDSELDFSEEYTPSLWLDTGSEFSDKSFDSTPSYCFSIFKQYNEQLLKFSSECDDDDDQVCSRHEDDNSNEVPFLRFEDEEYEESYRSLRSRERKRTLKVNDYEEYDSTMEFGKLILEQRSLMVNWIFEISHTKELRDETMFLGVHLFDRFLSKAFFTSKRSIELVGISCLTLATRIEEKQPLNYVVQKTFYVGSNVYSRSEVVAMEWLVQEVLKFRCLSPTMYSFLGFYLKAASADEEMEDKAKYLAELASLDHRQLRFWPSTVAAGLVILVSLAANRDQSCQRVMEAHIRTKVDDLPECLKVLTILM